MNQTYMKEKKIFPLVMSMALPMMLSMAFNSLYNIVDSYFVAKLSEDAMTALSLVYPAQNLLTAVAVGFGVGAVSYTHLEPRISPDWEPMRSWQYPLPAREQQQSPWIFPCIAF